MHPEVFVVGDLATIGQGGPGDPRVPALAPAAVEEGRHAAGCILADLAGRPRATFRYVDRGALAAIGRRAAVADFGWLRVTGFAAWVLWLVVHIFFLIGFRNRSVVMLEWSIAYWTYRRSARLILDPPCGM
jgi:NADH:ubiquinone reductase (H+-translocating)